MSAVSEPSGSRWRTARWRGQSRGIDDTRQAFAGGTKVMDLRIGRVLGLRVAPMTMDIIVKGYLVAEAPASAVVHVC